MSRPIDIKPQPNLGLTRLAQMTLNGIRYRLFRSLVTMVVVTVAIAFLMYILSESVTKRSMVEVGMERLSNYRLASFWASKLSTPASMEGLLKDFAQASSGDPVSSELEFFANSDASEVAELLPAVQQAHGFLDFLRRLDYGRLRLLTAGRDTFEVFEFLREPENLENFFQQASQMATLRMPLSNDELSELLLVWPSIEEFLRRTREGQRAAIAELRGSLGDRGMMGALLEASGEFGDTVRGQGFQLSEETAVALSEQANLMMVEAQVLEQLNRTDVRQAAAVRLNVLPAEVTLAGMWPLLSSDAGSRWWVESTNISESPIISSLAQQRLEEDQLADVEPLQAQLEGGLFGMGERVTWLIALSMVVCAVGIMNAMLMSVTERYREIATFKCLGALDGSIMWMFVMEAALIGLVGGVLGAFLGGLLGALAMTAGFGMLALQSLPLMQMVVAGLCCVAAGAILAAASSIYPSYKAARLAPMEAMRID
ncbi:MAG: ABC transporter permease [Verrucomicrobiales bacterium]